MAVADTSKRIEEAQELAKSEPAKAEQIYKEVLSTDPGSNETAIKNYERALVGLGELYRDQKRVDALAELVRQARSVLSSFAKAKTAKLGASLQYHFPQLFGTNTNIMQFGNYSTCSPPFQIPPIPRSTSQSHA